MGVLASGIGRKIGRNRPEDRPQIWSRCVTFRVGDDVQVRPPGGRVPDLPDLFQHGAGVVVDVDQALVDRVGEGLDRDVAIRPRRSWFRPRPEGWLAGEPVPACPGTAGADEDCSSGGFTSRNARPRPEIVPECGSQRWK
jgi:hypothetical protein